MAKHKNFGGKRYTLHRTISGGTGSSQRTRDEVNKLTRKGFYVRVTETRPKSAGKYIFNIWVRKVKRGERKPSTLHRKLGGRYLWTRA